ncbi:thioredoxin domain-containing protein 9 [Anabrus simplex]|uniref:thioredoxin domain-containing protein 9 n=1 Tax=Anabrus simplex TaxID=316456 RepID=UPI0034DCDD16
MDLQHSIQTEVLKAAQVVEQQIDAELQKYDNLDDLDKLRQQRLKELKNQAKQQQEWLSLGHREYTEIPEEKDFFDLTKKSKNFVCHFYKDDSPRCKIVDHHMKILANSHIETKFCKIDVLRAPFLTGKLRIKIIPTIALIKDGKTKDFIVGFTDLGNHDEFSTAMLEWRIAQSGVINYSGDLLNPPDESKRPKPIFGTKKTIRGKDSDDDDDGF